MYPFVRCPTCNAANIECFELFELLKNELCKDELKKKFNNKYNPFQIEIDNLVNIKLNEIFDLLHITNYCCRRNFITNVNFDSLLYSAPNN